MNARPDFERLEQLPPIKQREFFEEYRHEFQTERIRSDTKNVGIGDHLVVDRGTLYSHHFICTGLSQDGKVLVTEFSFDIVPKSMGIMFGDLGVFGTVKETKKTYKELENQQVYKIKWPQSLKRYGIKEIITRARSLIGKTYYSILENNCEQLVSWCICGIHLSLQVKEWYFFIREGINTIGSSMKEVATHKTAIKVFSNISDELVKMFGIEPSYLGFIIGGFLEAGLATYECRKALKSWSDGTYTDEEFKTKMVEILAKGICRYSGATLGSIMGTSFGPLGSLAGGAVGAGLGHLAGFLLSWCFKNRDFLFG